MNSGFSYPVVAATSKLRKNRKSRTDDTSQLVAIMAESIRQVGQIIHPILVRPVRGGYEILDGEIRWLGAKQAGLDIVPITVEPMHDQDAEELRAIINTDIALETDPEAIIFSLEALVAHFGSESGEIILERLAFVSEHNPNLSVEHQRRAIALLKACGIDPIA
jgi:ParB family chromosome partitioning protein